MTSIQTAAQERTRNGKPPAGVVSGFRSQDRETPIGPLQIEGELPRWLRGSLLRTGPAKWDVGTQTMRHWFDGLAMLHRFAFADGSATYASRFLESKAYRAASETGEITYSEFATDPCRSLFQRAFSIFSPKLTDNGNVNLTKLGERVIAMTETPIPVEFDAETLATVGVAYDVPGMLTTAHPHLDRATKGMLNYSAQLGPRNQYRFFLLRPEAKDPDVIARMPVREPAYMHSFGLTERWLVLAEFPLVVNPLRIVLSGRPYIENYRWRPELGTRFTLIDRSTGAASGPFETDACFAFHHVNAFERDGEVVVDVCAFPDASIIEDLYLDRLRAGEPVSAEPEVRRFRIRPGNGSVAHERAAEDGFDLPRINYGRNNERSYRYAWGVGWGGAGWLDRVIKADLDTGETRSWHEDGAFPGEPVFVAAPDGSGEDEGVLLSIVLDGARESSYLLVLDAATLEERARATVPERIPFGFHGQFAAA
jgi:beta,beta-carotene 9',10'-dioxygenase